jgi:NAD/NADP transhydrogenase beta subunit
MLGKKHAEEPISFNPIDLEDSQPTVEISSDDVQTFEKEKVELRNELESMVDNITVIEKQVIEIGQLQDQFSTKVSMQAEEISNLHQTTIKSTVHLVRAKTQLQNILTDSSDFRLFIIVLMLSLSFGLLFVHYYN